MEGAEGGAGGSHEGNQRDSDVSGEDTPFSTVLSGVVQTPLGPWPFGDITLEVSRRDNRMYRFILRVPFRSPIAAEAGQQCVAAFGETPHVCRDITVNDSLLTVTWTSRNPYRLILVLPQFLNNLALLLPCHAVLWTFTRT